MTDGQLLTAQIRIGDDGVRREVGDELILLDLDSEAYYGLNPTARAFVEGGVRRRHAGRGGGGDRR